MRRWVDALAVEVALADADQVVSGTSRVGAAVLGTLREAEIGIWEITPGVVRDVEADEVFVVLSGEGTLRFEGGETVELRAGSLVRLHEGEHTEWEIRSTLRKVYLG